MILNWLLVLSPSSVFAFKRRVVLNSSEIRTLPKLMIHTVCPLTPLPLRKTTPEFGTGEPGKRKKQVWCAQSVERIVPTSRAWSCMGTCTGKAIGSAAIRAIEASTGAASRHATSTVTRPSSPRYIPLAIQQGAPRDNLSSQGGGDPFSI